MLQIVIHELLNITQNFEFRSILIYVFFMINFLFFYRIIDIYSFYVLIFMTFSLVSKLPIFLLFSVVIYFIRIFNLILNHDFFELIFFVIKIQVLIKYVKDIPQIYIYDTNYINNHHL